MRCGRWGWLVLLAGAAGAADWQVTATASPDRVRVGQTCDLCVTVTAAQAGGETPRIELEPLALRVGLAPASARFQSLRRVAGRWQYTVCQALVGDRLGTVTIAPVRVTIASGGDTVARSTPPVTVFVMAAGAGESSRPRGRPAFSWWVPAAGGAGLLLAAAAALLWVRRDAPPATPRWDPRSAEGQAVVALRGASNRLARGDLEGCYAAMAAGLYTYVARASGTPGAGLTTTEARERLAVAGFDADLREAVGGALTVADAVRFAREPSSAEEAGALLRRLESAFLQAGKDHQAWTPRSRS